MNVEKSIITYQLAVGYYIININVSDRRYQLPYYADQFLIKGVHSENERIFHYDIQPETICPEAFFTPIAGFYNGPFPYQVSRLPNGDLLWVRGKRDSEEKLVYQISSDWNHWRLIADSTKNKGTNSFDELAYIFAYSVLNKGGILFHGVILEWQGRGIIISAYSGVGKTTHARMWRDYENALIINGDRALCCRIGDQWYAYGAPWSGTSGEHLQRRVKLNAIVFLERDVCNKVSQLSKVQGAKELLKHVFAPYWDMELISHALDTIDHIVQNIPILRLQCRADREAVDVLKRSCIEIINLGGSYDGMFK